MVRNVHGTKSPPMVQTSMVRIVYGTKSLVPHVTGFTHCALISLCVCLYLYFLVLYAHACCVIVSNVAHRMSHRIQIEGVDGAVLYSHWQQRRRTVMSSGVVC